MPAPDAQHPMRMYGLEDDGILRMTGILCSVAAKVSERSCRPTSCFDDIGKGTLNDGSPWPQTSTVIGRSTPISGHCCGDPEQHHRWNEDHQPPASALSPSQVKPLQPPGSSFAHGTCPQNVTYHQGDPIRRESPCSATRVSRLTRNETDGMSSNEARPCKDPYVASPVFNLRSRRV